MPTYDYECLKCGYNFEAFQKMSEGRLKVCPKCRGKLKRLIGPGCGIIFKGSGFYATDYKRSAGESGKQPADKKDKKEKGPEKKEEKPKASPAQANEGSP